MYESYDYGALFGFASGVGLVVSILFTALFVCLVVAYFLTIASLVKMARAKGSLLGSGRLWFIGIFTTPIVLGVVVAAMPDRGNGSTGIKAN